MLTKSKEGKKALAAAAGVEVALDSPVVEKAQPIHPPSPAKAARKYTAVLQVRPKLLCHPVSLRISLTFT